MRHALIVNPLGMKTNLSPDDMIECCGFIPRWVARYILAGETSDLKEYLEKCYGFGALYEMTGGEVKENGAYVYPGDPELKPIVEFQIQQPDGTKYVVRQYEYAIVSIKKNDTVFVTRMD